MNTKWKKLLGIGTASLLLLAACGDDGTGGNGGTDTSGDTEGESSVADDEDVEIETFGSGDQVLEVWSFTDEINTFVEEYFIPDHPDIDYQIEIVNIPTEEFETKLDPIINTDDAPDVILLEQNFAKKYVESGLLADFAAFDNIMQGSEDTYEYVLGIGTSEDGVFNATAWQAAPGAFFYRESMAEEYLDASTPEEVQELISDWDGFIETARQLNEASNGEKYMISSTGADLRFPYLGTRETGWVVDGELVIDDQITEMLETARLMVDEGLTLDVEAEGEEYFAGMNGDEIFGYTLPTWALHFWLKPNAENTAGDWKMVQGPAPYFRGGTWIGMLGNSDMQEAASELITYVGTDEDFLTQWAQDSGDVVSNQAVVESIKDEYSDEFLGGQNHYAAFADMIEDINTDIITEYDQEINSLFLDHALTPYSKGEVELEEAMDNFKAQVQNSYPDMVVE